MSVRECQFPSALRMRLRLQKFEKSNSQPHPSYSSTPLAYSQILTRSHGKGKSGAKTAGNRWIRPGWRSSRLLRLLVPGREKNGGDDETRTLDLCRGSTAF